MMDIAKIVEAHAAGAFNFLPRPHNYDTLTQCTVVLESDEAIDTNRKLSGPCHACARPFLTRDDSLVTVSSCKEGVLEIPGALRFYEWLLNESDFRDAFIVKDAALSIVNGFVVDNLVHPSIWLGANQLHRLPASEWASTFLAICKILDNFPQADVYKVMTFALAHKWELSSDELYVVGTESVAGSLINNNLRVHAALHIPFGAITSNDEWDDYFCNVGGKEVPQSINPQVTARDVGLGSSNFKYLMSYGSSEKAGYTHPVTMKEALRMTYENGFTTFGQALLDGNERVVDDLPYYGQLFLEAAATIEPIEEFRPKAKHVGGDYKVNLSFVVN